VTSESQPAKDEQLARRAQAGCASSFEELVHRYEARVFRFVLNSSRNASDAQEVTQDVFVTAFHKLDKFNADRSFVTWLFTIARRKCIDHHRSVRTVAGEVLPEETDGNDPAELLAQREAERDIWGLAKHILPPSQFEVLWLRCAEDMDVATVARILHRTKTHVKVLLFRARLKLDQELAKRRDDARIAREGAGQGSASPVRSGSLHLSRGHATANAGVQT